MTMYTNFVTIFWKFRTWMDDEVNNEFKILEDNFFKLISNDHTKTKGIYHNCLRNGEVTLTND